MRPTASAIGCAARRPNTLRELVAYVGELTGHRRPILALGPGLSSSSMRSLLERLPGKLMSRDNLFDLERQSASTARFRRCSAIPVALEAIAPTYIAAAAPTSRFSAASRPHRGA